MISLSCQFSYLNCCGGGLLCGGGRLFPPPKKPPNKPCPHAMPTKAAKMTRVLILWLEKVGSIFWDVTTSTKCWKLICRKGLLRFYVRNRVPTLGRAWTFTTPPLPSRSSSSPPTSSTWSIGVTPWAAAPPQTGCRRNPWKMFIFQVRQTMDPCQSRKKERIFGHGS